MKQFKKLLYLRTDIYYKPLQAGGSVTHTLGVVEGFLEEGIEVHCASSCIVDQLEKLPLSSLTLLSIPYFILLFFRWKLSCFFSNLFFFITLVRKYKNCSFDYIYQRYSVLNVVGLLCRWWFKVPLILEYNGSEKWAISHWGPKNWFQLSWLIEWFENINLKKSDFIIVVSDALKEDLINQGIDSFKILVNPNGVNPKHFEPAVMAISRAEIREKLNLQNKFVFGFIGTFEQWHGINILEKIIPSIYEKNKDIHWLLIGDGPLKKPLEKKLQGINSYNFTGIVCHEIARKYLAACDAFICPTQPNKDGSRFFGSPTKLFEYMCLKKPIIASEVEQISTIFTPAKKSLHHEFKGNELSYLLPTQDIDVYGDCCLYIANSVNKSEQITVGLNAYKKVINHYTWHHHVQKIVCWVVCKENIDFKKNP